MNNGDAPQPFPYNEFVLRDASDRTFSLDTDPTIPLQIEAYGVAMYDQLQLGLVYETAMVFDVPPDATDIVLEEKGESSWRIPIGI